MADPVVQKILRNIPVDSAPQADLEEFEELVSASWHCRRDESRPLALAKQGDDLYTYLTEMHSHSRDYFIDREVLIVRPPTQQGPESRFYQPQTHSLPIINEYVPRSILLPKVRESIQALGRVNQKATNQHKFPITYNFPEFQDIKNASLSELADFCSQCKQIPALKHLFSEGATKTGPSDLEVWKCK